MPFFSLPLPSATVRSRFRKRKGRPNLLLPSSHFFFLLPESWRGERVREKRRKKEGRHLGIFLSESTFTRGRRKKRKAEGRPKITTSYLVAMLKQKKNVEKRGGRDGQFPFGFFRRSNREGIQKKETADLLQHPCRGTSAVDAGRREGLACPYASLTLLAAAGQGTLNKEGGERCCRNHATRPHYALGGAPSEKGTALGDEWLECLLSIQRRGDRRGEKKGAKIAAPTNLVRCRGGESARGGGRKRKARRFLAVSLRSGGEGKCWLIIFYTAFEGKESGAPYPSYYLPLTHN